VTVAAILGDVLEVLVGRGGATWRAIASKGRRRKCSTMAGFCPHSLRKVSLWSRHLRQQYRHSRADTGAGRKTGRHVVPGHPTTLPGHRLLPGPAPGLPLLTRLTAPECQG
jgi:hypothetical protein